MNSGRTREGSLICRILGNPLAHAIVCAIGRGRRRPIELARELGSSPSAVVNQLRIMKAAGLVRWRSSGVRRKGRVVEYWLTDSSLLRVCEVAQAVVQRVRSSVTRDA
ncbi:MAG: helix-turn-helix transcriptional regulator [Planctomycetes bacterium]|nr:helix-turn-helix transcriptional regulator [Planctomycetota bacterium]